MSHIGAEASGRSEIHTGSVPYFFHVYILYLECTCLI